MTKTITRKTAAVQTAVATATQAPAFITVKQAADLVHLSEVSIRRYLTLKRLRRYKAGARTLLRHDDVMSLVHEA
jgi:excisionase family DNA binding protein